MIYLEGDRSDTYGFHRHGWAWVVDHIAANLHSDSASVSLFSFCEQKFLYGSRLGERLNDYEAPSKPWIGIFHLPPCVPQWYSSTHQLSRFLTEDIPRESLANCVATISLSDYLANYMGKVVCPNIPSYSLLHPTPFDVSSFDRDQFFNDWRQSGKLRICQLGFWLRKHHFIHRLISEGLNDVMPFQVGINSVNQKNTFRRDLKINNVSVQDKVFLTSKLSSSDYDRLLSSSLVLLPLYDTSANNSLIECISRGTPILIEKHPATVQYLGADYPLFFNSYQQCLDILTSEDLVYRVESACSYMSILRYQQALHIDRFIDSMKDIISSFPLS
jgi:hypothetical protein